MPVRRLGKRRGDGSGSRPRSLTGAVTTSGHNGRRGTPSAIRGRDDGHHQAAPVWPVGSRRAQPGRLPADQPVHVLRGPGPARPVPRSLRVADPGRGDALVRDRLGAQLRAQPGAQLPQPRRRRQAVPGLRGGQRQQLPDLRTRAHRPAVRRRRVLRALPDHRGLLRGRLPLHHAALRGVPRQSRRRERRGGRRGPGRPGGRCRRGAASGRTSARAGRPGRVTPAGGDAVVSRRPRRPAARRRSGPGARPPRRPRPCRCRSPRSGCHRSAPPSGSFCPSR
jgi:hypothetical protein